MRDILGASAWWLPALFTVTLTKEELERVITISGGVILVKRETWTICSEEISAGVFHIWLEKK